MNMRQQIREERKAFFATATKKEKISYIWHYYGLYISMSLILLGIITYIIVQAVTAPETILNGILANSYNHENSFAISEFEELYMEDREIDTSEYTVSFGGGITLNDSSLLSSYESSNVIITHIAAENLDFIIGPEAGLKNFAYDDLFADLSKVLTEELYEYYQPYFLYVDKAVIAEKQAIDSIDNTTVIEIPDATKPEEMKEPVPVYIDLSSSDKLDSIYGNASDSMVFVIAGNAVNMEQTIDLLEYLMK